MSPLRHSGQHGGGVPRTTEWHVASSSVGII